MAIYEDFKKLDIRVGQIISAEDFPEARKPSYRLGVDFGEEVGSKESCAQLVPKYTKEELMGRLVLGVVNLPPMRIGPAISEVLILGTPDERGNCVLATPGEDAVVGSRLY